MRRRPERGGRGGRAARAGLTLIEVLVAAVVCGAGVAVVATGVSAAVRAEAYAGGLSRAAAHAELLLSRLEGGIVLPGDGQGTFADDGAPDLVWQVSVATTDVENLSLVVVTIEWSLHGVPRELRLERLHFEDPLESEAR